MKHLKIGRVVGVVVIMWVVLLSTPDGRPASARAVPTPSPHCGGWSIVPSPNPTDYNNELYAVAAVSATDVWAVGESYPIHGPGGALIEHWNGTAWQVAASPVVEGAFFSIAAVSATNVWTIGGGVTGPLIEHWDGTSWQSVTSPAVDGYLTSISAQSASDIWVVGAQLNGGLLTEHWDGTAWHFIPAPGVPNYASQLNSIAAISATDAWAVGYASIYRGPSNTLIEHWDGQQWSIVSSPNGSKGRHRLNTLLSVTAVSAQNVWAVGFDEGPLIEQWDGTRWSVTPSPNPPSGELGALYGVVAIPGAAILAAGTYQYYFPFQFRTLVEQWDGTQWQVVASPNVTATTISAANDNTLNGVSASSAHNIWAVGYYAPEGGDTTYTLIESYC